MAIPSARRVLPSALLACACAQTLARDPAGTTKADDDPWLAVAVEEAVQTPAPPRPTPPAGFAQPASPTASPTESQPEAAREAFSAGASAFDRGEFVLAAQLFERALQLSPDQSALAFNAGKAWVNAGDCRRAQVSFARALVGDERLQAEVDRLLAAGCTDD